jgi:hypothetical protein
MALADQQPVRVQPLQLARLVDVGDWHDGTRTASEGVRRQGKGAEDVDDDCETAGAARARYEVSNVELSRPPPAWHAAVSRRAWRLPAARS